MFIHLIYAVYDAAARAATNSGRAVHDAAQHAVGFRRRRGVPGVPAAPPPERARP